MLVSMKGHLPGASGDVLGVHISQQSRTAEAHSRYEIPASGS